MNNIETEKNRLANIYSSGVSEKTIDKKIIGGYLQGDDNFYSLWEETIETNEIENEKLEPIYPFGGQGGGCSNSPTHRAIHYQDEKGRIRWNCCVKPQWVKYYKKKYNYYLTYYQPNDFIKIKTTARLPADTKGISYSQFLTVESSELSKDYKWLGNLLTNGQLFFGSKEEENQQIKKDFIEAYNKFINK